MKYTNGKKADTTAFPFKVEAPKPGDSPLEKFSWGGGKRGRVERKNEMRARSGQGGGANEAVNARVEEKIEEKADAIVNQESGEGLV